jgi:hypothetical protein
MGIRPAGRGAEVEAGKLDRVPEPHQRSGRSRFQIATAAAGLGTSQCSAGPSGGHAGISGALLEASSSRQPCKRRRSRAPGGDLVEQPPRGSLPLSPWPAPRASPARGRARWRAPTARCASRPRCTSSALRAASTCRKRSSCRDRQGPLGRRKSEPMVNGLQELAG